MHVTYQEGQTPSLTPVIYHQLVLVPWARQTHPNYHDHTLFPFTGGDHLYFR
jgi:hypothetical protein